MNYDIYELIMDLAEAGYTITFKPIFTDHIYRPSRISITISTEDDSSFRTPDPLQIRDAGEAELRNMMIDMAKHLIIRKNNAPKEDER